MIIYFVDDSESARLCPCTNYPSYTSGCLHACPASSTLDTNKFTEEASRYYSVAFVRTKPDRLPYGPLDRDSNLN